MNPLELFVLNTEETMGDQIAHRSYLFTDKAIAHAAGARLQRHKPTEVDAFTYWVVPLEGRP